MRAPRPPDTPIDNRRRTGWKTRFEGYRHSVTDATLTDWLDQFDARDRDTAARVLDTVEFISAEHIDVAFREVLKRLEGWDPDEAKRRGRFAFVPFSSGAGESGDAMLHRFRLATRMNQRAHANLFIGRSDIVRQRLGKDDTVVFVDDFVGSGNQAVNAWNQMFQELTAEVGRVYLVTVAAFQKGAELVRDNTRMELISHRHLTLGDSVPDSQCKHFSAAEKSRILHYCKRASPDRPLGFGECGLVIVLSHQCPNNSLALLHATSRTWEPLFPRN